jgi:uncharacterized cupredoxin-like copper-binding protein
MKRQAWSVLGVAAASLALVACEDASTNLVPGATVQVDLSEWKIATNRATAPAGHLVINVTNNGADVHNLVFLETDLAPDALPVTTAGDVDVAGPGVLSVAEVKDIAPGTSGSVTLGDAVPDKYVFVCTVATSNGMSVGHPYKLGMFQAFTLTEAPGQE